MPEESSILEQMMQVLGDLYGQDLERYAIPPPVFTAMLGEFISFDTEKAILEARFPVLREWLNPYGIMQGGMMAAAIDNTIGPLSMMVASANVTRRMEIKYSRGVTQDLGSVFVEARCGERDGRRLTFRATARSPLGDLLARATATHWILEEADGQR